MNRKQSKHLQYKNMLENRKCMRGFHASKEHRLKSNMEPYVFHMQHDATSLNLPFGMVFHLSEASQAIRMGGLAVFMLVASSQTLQAEDDPICLNYYTVGDSTCRPAASTPVGKPAAVTSSKPVKESEKPQKSAVDSYLDNYGKPPREFVEFYLNPTPENAQKWMKTYHQMVERGNQVSRAWQDADQLYQSVDSVSSGLSRPTTPAVTPTPNIASPYFPQVTEIKPKEVSKPVNIGAFATQNESMSSSLGGVHIPTLSLTYYYSQTCPYCARMTPDLAVIAREVKSKLVFTCVDVTPLGAKSGPNEAFITSKLPCTWRLPEAGEVEREGVAQTPTLLIQKEGKDEVRLSGYVPLVQLRQYF